MSKVFTTMSAAPGGGPANNLHPLYYDGAMFANDGDFVTYGGLLSKTDAYTLPAADDVEVYQAYWYGASRSTFSPGFVNGRLPDGVTRYVTYGAAASVPSENKGFYFSGLRSPSSGPIFYTSSNRSFLANIPSNTLISVDLSNQISQTWSNKTLPSTAPGRANAELVWVPVGKNGVLIAIGGVVDPIYTYPSQHLNESQLANDVSQHEPNAFIQNKLIKPT
jgi:hypothetical protein